MTVTALSATGADRKVGDEWALSVLVTDADCDATDAAAPVVTVTLPGGTTATPSVERLATGVYRAEYTIGVAGRHIARAVAAGYGVATFVAFAEAVVAEGGMPDAAAVAAYLGAEAASWTDEEVEDELASESAAQRRVCRVPAEFPADLRKALIRRTARALFMRRQMTELPRSDGDVELPPLVPPGNDPEVRRYEKPWRKLVMR